jgi:hypothetical protein
MKRPTMLVKAVLHQAALDLDLSVERDIQRIECRCEHEGLSFLTITLPSLSDALERGIEDGTFTCPTSFSRHGSLPRFLGGFFKRVFTHDGKLLPEVDPDVIFYIRQICRFFKKLKIGCSPSREKKAIDHFIEVEGELRRMTSQVERKDNILDNIAGIIWSQVFPEIDYHDLVCHHGPGVTADRRHSNERHRISQWNHRSELTYPSDLHCYPNYGAAAAGGTRAGTDCEKGEIEYLDVRDELPVRVVFVPKTQTAPRVIAIEPSHVQFMQQSVKDFVYARLENDSLTRHSIRFSRQEPNQRLAYSSSIDRRLATLDLKDASDRVHLHLVQRIFKTSGLLEYLEDARSLHATLPNGRNIVLFKYASMGSALCFPVEAMVFYTLIQSAMHQLDGRRPSSRSIREYSRQIDIYGDDIIIPVEYTDVVVKYLESYALKVNINKSFRFSNFRESCGADFYNGVQVNPVYARTVPHDDSRHWGAEEVMSWNATADLFYMRGMWIVAQEIRTLLSRVVRRTIPKARKLGSGLAHFSYLFTTDLKWNRDLCGWKQKRLHYDPIKRKDSIDGDELACLNKWGQGIVASQRRTSKGIHVNSGNSERGIRGGLPYSVPEWHNPQGGSPDCGVQHLDSSPGAWFSYWGICGVPLHSADERETLPLLSAVGGTSTCSSAEHAWDSRQGRNFSADYCLTEEVQSDPLYYLYGRSSGDDFLASTKRGCFKSKSRWVSITS